MDYKAVYYRIIEKAKKETELGNRKTGYYEKHHIQPRSLGGSNNKENLVRLTAREHFICHWLLVKMYNKGTVERNKMLCALWKMHAINNIQKRYINARAYEALRIEFAKLMCINQSGKNNSQFGTTWYTNRNTGESKRFKCKPIENFWIKGRNIFQGESSILKFKTSNLYKKSVKITYASYFKSLKEAQEWWDKFHNGNYKKLDDFAQEINKTRNAVFVKFKRYIPIFSTGKKRSCRQYSSNKDLVGKYE